MTISTKDWANKLVGQIIIFACLVCPISLNAEEPETDNELQYHVEVIVFEHLDKASLEEAWPLNPGKPNFEGAKLLHKPTKPEDDEQNSEDDDESEEEIDFDADSFSAYEFLPKKQYKLMDAKNRIKGKGVYRIIIHRAWQQPIFGRNTAVPVRLHAGKKYNLDDEKNQNFEDVYAKNPIDNALLYELDGTFTISKSRHIHVATDFIFSKPMRVLTPASGQVAPTVQLTNVRNRHRWQTESNARLQPFRLDQAVRLKKGAVQYIDHPMYGIMILVTPQEEAKDNV